MEHTLPPSYGEQPQAYIKHRLLESYLQKLVRIVGMGAREICYIDCFAGPWGPPSEDMAATSIGISLRTLNACRRELAARGASPKVRALYVENGAAAYGRLAAYIGAHTPEGIEAKSLRGDFVSLRTQILDWVGPHAFAFFFIDPTGFKEIGAPTLAPLLERQGSEFLINFMYDHINRNMEIAELQPIMTTLLGERIDLETLSPEGREHAILATYRKNCKSRMTATPKQTARSAYARVMDPERERPKYHLVYFTSHPRGIVAFMEISQGVDIVQRQVRAELKFEKRTRRMGDFFGAESFIDPGDGRVSADDVDSYWLKYLHATGGRRRVGLDAFAEILERTDWFPEDLQSSLGRLIRDSRVVNTDAPRARPKKPLHFDAHSGAGEWLQLKDLA